MALTPRTPIAEINVDRVFIGSCTNSRIEDLRAAAKVIKGYHVDSHVHAMVVPGSQKIKAAGRERRPGRDLHATPVSTGASPAARCAWR